VFLDCSKRRENETEGREGKGREGKGRFSIFFVLKIVCRALCLSVVLGLSLKGFLFVVV
jgi:hypothetical protein